MQLSNISRKGSEHISELFLRIFGGIFLKVVDRNRNNFIYNQIHKNRLKWPIHYFLSSGWMQIINNDYFRSKTSD